MRIKYTPLIIGYFLLILGTDARYKKSRVQHNDFYSKNILKHGVHLILIYVNGIRTQQTVAGPMEGTMGGIVVRQVSNGKQVVNLIYNGIPPYLRDMERFQYVTAGESSLVGEDEDGLSLKGCQIDKEESEVKPFILQFDTFAHMLQNTTQFSTTVPSTVNSSYIFLHPTLDNLPLHLTPLTRFHNLKYKCFELNRSIRKIFKIQRTEKRLKRLFNSTSTSHRNRSRRGLHELMILPGTKWCGNSRLANSFSDLDGNIMTDHCCRVHDLCPSSIPRMSRKYGLYNHRLTTISHCSCDNRFKTCLKQTGTGASDVVGNVFFNIVKSSCFVFKKKKTCHKRGFWSCLKWGYEKQAVIRNPIPWNL